MIYIPNKTQYQLIYGRINVNMISMARCACVSCNSCTCACSCRGTTVSIINF